MIHFFSIFSKDVSKTPFARAIVASKISHRIFADYINLSYRNKMEFFSLRLPGLAWFALKSSFKSLALSNPRPNAVVLNSDIEVFIFGVIKIIFFKKNTMIVLGSFIYTDRFNPFIRVLRKFYFKHMLRLTNLVIVHSRLEVDRYSRIFSGSGTKFEFIPWCTNIEIRTHLFEQKAKDINQSRTFYLASAGKSGRDYQTLCAATEGIKIETRIICDYEGALKNIKLHDGVKILSHCHGLDYINQIFNAQIVVVPLSVENISAGQMVLVQAMSLGKAIIATKTPTIADYVCDNYNALLVERGSISDLRNSITDLLNNSNKKKLLEKNALDTYEKSLKTEYGVKRLIEVIYEYIPSI